MYDALKMFTPKAEEKSTIIRDLNLQNEKFFVATIHREENTASKESLDSIFKALETISEDCAIVLPVHPRTRSAAEAFGFGKGVRIINPVGYLDMLQLLKNCRGVITDSGGLQKEAYFAGKYCITVRFQTEWVELVDEGKNILVGNDYQKIVEAYKFIRDKETFSPSPLYGLGDASEIIVEVLKNKYKQ
ncbi:MAG: UDP-N-acetyl glucosamine 2-epimerase, partial [Cyclobacteriaceae bacterium]|nr:UDP-N-acetyl glucosamine 2-epimerase [Cyclobacteriaceae bacterium]